MRYLISRHVFSRRLVALFTFVAPVTSMLAQSVLVAPNVVVLDGRTRTTAITLVNTGSAAAEVDLSTTFGYPVSDSAGVMRLQTFTSVNDSMPSAAGFVHAYPSQFMLAPGARRVVRLLATPPENTRDGEYWARLVVTTRAARVRSPDAGAESPNASHIGLDLEIRSLLPLFYRQGAVTTGILMDSLHTAVERDSLSVRIPMQRRGNAAFVGSVRASLRNASGAVLVSTSLPLGVYFDLEPRIAFSRRGLGSGEFTVEVEAISQRPDVAPRYLLPSAIVSARAPLHLAAARP